MTLKSGLACAVFLLVSATAGGAEQMDFQRIAKEVTEGADFDQAVPAPPAGLLSQKRTQALGRLAPGDRAGFEKYEPRDAAGRLGYYNRIIGVR